MTEST
jgi:hypothetical protein